MRDENAPDTKINVTLLQSHYPQFIGANVHYDIAAALTPAYIQQSIKSKDDGGRAAASNRWE